MQAEDKRESDWVRPVVEQSTLRRFIETIRASLGLVLAIVLLVTAAAIAYAVTADDVYEAQAKLLISPIPATDTSLSGLGLIRESSDPTLDIETAAQLVTTLEVAEEAAAQLDTSDSPEDLLSDVRADPVGQSNIVAIVAKSPTAMGATDLANAFAAAVITVRTEALHRQVAQILPQLNDQLESAPAGGLASDSLAQQVAQLVTLGAGPDPTFRFETPATPPDNPIWPRPLLTILGGALLGLALASAIAFLLRALDPRLRREEQLREMYRLPILARIPKDRAARSNVPLRPGSVSAPTLEAYRTLRATLTSPRGKDKTRARSFLLTSPSPSEGKTSSALNLAAAMAMAGQHTVLIEADLRRPMVGEAVGFSPPHGIAQVLQGEVEVEDALVQAPGFGANLELLITDRPDRASAELFGLGAGQTLIEEALTHADNVVVDSAPLTAVVDSLPLARQVDGVVIVVRIGKTNLRRIRELGELLAGNGITPVGFVVVETPRPTGELNYYYRENSPRGRGGSRKERRESQRTRGEVRAPAEAEWADR
ncbi:MAG: Wzz/FepE/Etk N-terminal domain-containing protein [Solirubrobacterales bacterium]